MLAIPLQPRTNVSLNISFLKHVKLLLDNNKVSVCQLDERLHLLNIKVGHTSPRGSKSPFWLPTELNHSIMAFLSDDDAALRASALTCRAWLATARYYLFRYIRISNRKQMQDLLGAIQTSPMISDCIRSIQIGEKTSDAIFCHSSVSSFLSSLADLPNPPLNLSYLELAGVGEVWKARTIKKLASLTGVFKLSLFRCGLSPDDLCALISAFPGLKQVKIEHCTNNFRGRQKQAGLPRLNTPRLSSFTLNNINLFVENSHSILDYILSTPSRHSLRSAQLIVADGDVEPVGQFLLALGPNLEELEFGLWIEMGKLVQLCNKVLTNIDLSYNNNIQELTLHDPTCPIIQLLLTQISSPRLHRITFRIQPVLFACGNQSALSAILLNCEFRNLSSVRCIYDGLYQPRVEAQLREVFRDFDKKGMLHVASSR